MVPKWRCDACGAHPQRPYDFNPNINPFIPFDRPLPVSQSRRYVVTCAQNATPAHKKFLATLQVYCKETGAALVIIPLRYYNPTSRWSDRASSQDWWDDALLDDMYSGRYELNSNLMLLGDTRTQITAEKPLTGFESITHAKSGIIGHPKVQLRTIATPAHKLPKLMTTTGAVTGADNYTQSKAGKKAQFHHTLGAVVIELDGERFHMRQINALNNGAFIDLNRKYTPTGSVEASQAAALVMGDSHIQFIDEQVVAATFGEGGIVPTLRPRQLIWHDVLDFYSQSHWHRANPFVRYAKHLAHMDNIKDELELTCRFIADNTPEGVKSVLVPSNHNEGLERWVREHDWKVDPSHMQFYLETALEMVRSTKMTDSGSWTVDPFHYWARRLLPNTEAVFLARDESHSVRGIECGFHGDVGPNGSRGSVEGFKRIGVKSVIGHAHSPAIEEGCYQVGTNSRLKLEYNTGPSGWMHTDCVIYENGKRSLLHIIDGKWRP